MGSPYAQAFMFLQQIGGNPGGQGLMGCDAAGFTSVDFFSASPAEHATSNRQTPSLM